jgi:hypothetical protein
VEAAGADPVSHSPALDPGCSELVQMHMAVLQLCDASDLGVTHPSNLLKPNNRPR